MNGEVNLLPAIALLTTTLSYIVFSPVTMYGDLKHCSLFIIAYNDVWRFIDIASSKICLILSSPHPNRLMMCLVSGEVDLIIDNGSQHQHTAVVNVRIWPDLG